MFELGPCITFLSSASSPTWSLESLFTSGSTWTLIDRSGVCAPPSWRSSACSQQSLTEQPQYYGTPSYCQQPFDCRYFDENFVSFPPSAATPVFITTWVNVSAQSLPSTCPSLSTKNCSFVTSNSSSYFIADAEYFTVPHPPLPRAMTSQLAMFHSVSVRRFNISVDNRGLSGSLLRLDGTPMSPCDGLSNVSL